MHSLNARSEGKWSKGHSFFERTYDTRMFVQADVTLPSEWLPFAASKAEWTSAKRSFVRVSGKRPCHEATFVRPKAEWQSKTDDAKPNAVLSRSSAKLSTVTSPASYWPLTLRTRLFTNLRFLLILVVWVLTWNWWKSIWDTCVNMDNVFCKRQGQNDKMLNELMILFDFCLTSSA